jgi:gamma-glutamyl-gamma-aminobutyrate hydrolase PuuD
MKFVAVSQRIEWLADRRERRDCLDQGWADFCNAVGMGMVPVPNRIDSLDQWLIRLNPSALILTGGNDVSIVAGSDSLFADRDIAEAKLVEWATTHRLPILAVCRGFQFINVRFGGTVRRVESHVNRIHALESDAGTSQDFPVPVNVNSFHEYGILPDDLAPSMTQVALAPDGSVEAAIHRTLPIVSTMWHPERVPVVGGAFLAFLRKHLNSDL